MSTCEAWNPNTNTDSRSGLDNNRCLWARKAQFTQQHRWKDRQLYVTLRKPITTTFSQTMRMHLKWKLIKPEVKLKKIKEGPGYTVVIETLMKAGSRWNLSPGFNYSDCQYRIKAFNSWAFNTHCSLHLEKQPLIPVCWGHSLCKPLQCLTFSNLWKLNILPIIYTHNTVYCILIFIFWYLY